MSSAVRRGRREKNELRPEDMNATIAKDLARLRADLGLPDLATQVDLCSRRWRALCRKHGGAKRARAFAFDGKAPESDAAMAVITDLRGAQWKYRRAVTTFRCAALSAAVTSCLDAMKAQEMAKASAL